LGVANLAFAQADIIALDGKSFDLIETTGVLHHMADPFAAWSKLLSLLRPGGVMRLGFYSEAARADVVAGRAFVAARGSDATADSIRAFRQNLMRSSDPRLRRIPASPDFYSISGCRDLLFHVQEHRLTLPQIAAFMAENGLSFLGFELDAAAFARYRRDHP